MSSLGDCNTAKRAAMEQACLDEEYLNTRVEDMRGKLGTIPYAFPRMDQFPMAWKLIHTLVYDFLAKLGLQNTLNVFSVESEMKQALSVLEVGWFLKSFIMHPNFHSVLMFLLGQFTSAEDRIAEIVREERCNLENECNNVNQGPSDLDACMDGERKKTNAERMCEARKIIEEQMQQGNCDVRGEQSRKEAEQRRKTEEREMLDERCRREAQEQSFRDMERASSMSRARILESIREKNNRDAAAMKAKEMNLRAENERRRRSYAVAEEENRRLERDVLVNTRKRIIDQMFGQLDCPVVIEDSEAEKVYEIQDSTTDDGDCFVVEDDEDEGQGPEGQQPPTQQELQAMCDRFGIDLNSAFQQNSRRFTNEDRGYGQSVGDPRRTQSFKGNRRSGAPGWQVQPLGPMGAMGGAPQIVVDDADCPVVMEAPADDEVCEHHPQYLQVPSKRPSRIPRSRVSQRRSQQLSRSPNISRQRGSQGPRQSMQAHGESCLCPERSKRMQVEREARAADDYIHFSRRTPSRNPGGRRSAQRGQMG